MEYPDTEGYHAPIPRSGETGANPLSPGQAFVDAEMQKPQPMKAYTKGKSKVKVTFRQMWDIANAQKGGLPYCHAPYGMAEGEFFSKYKPTQFVLLDRMPTWEDLKAGIVYNRRTLVKFF